MNDFFKDSLQYREEREAERLREKNGTNEYFTPGERRAFLRRAGREGGFFDRGRATEAAEEHRRAAIAKATGDA